MVIIAKVSRGSKMDQIYIPKNRIGLEIGGYVEIKQLNKSFKSKVLQRKLYNYGIKHIESIKSEIINKAIELIEDNVNNDNIIFTGSFLEKGFEFRDLDIMIISNIKFDVKKLEELIEKKIGIKTHIVLIDNKSLLSELASDPLYSIILSKCIAKKRFIYRTKKEIGYKILDLHLLKSKALIDNFDILNGIEKYSLVRNFIAIYLFLRKDKFGKEEVDKEIKNIFGLKEINEIKFNMLQKEKFLRKYKYIYGKTSNKLMEGIKHGSK